MGDNATLGGGGGAGAANVTGTVALRPDQVGNARGRASSTNVSSILGGSVRIVNGRAEIRLRTSAGTLIVTPAQLTTLNNSLTAGGGTRFNTNRGQAVITASPQRIADTRNITAQLLRNAAVLQTRADRGRRVPEVLIANRGRGG